MKIRIFLFTLLGLLIIAGVLGIRRQSRIDYSGTASSTSATSTDMSSCAVNECPTELTAADSGGTFTYTETSRFTLFLNPAQNPKSHLSCTPAGIIGTISNIPPAPQGLYAARFEGVQPGTCVLTDDHFQATIIIVGSN